MVNMVDSIKKVSPKLYTSVQAVPPVQKEVEDRGIFAEQGLQQDFTSLVNASLLEDQLSFVQKEQGALMRGWDNFKGDIGIGTSSEKCEDAIEKYKKGEMTFEEAMSEIEKFSNKQSSSLDLFSNIATAAAALAATVATGGVAGIAIGAAVGAGTKAGFKAADRATNDIKGDALDGKQLAKDALSGAVTGGIAVATAGTAKNPFDNGFKVAGKQVIGAGKKACVAKCATTGVVTGAISGASNYTIDCAFEENKDFNVKDLAVNTATSSLVGGTVGAVMGGFNGALRANNANFFKNIDADTTKTLIANSVCSAEYKLLNSGIRSIAA